MRRRLVAVLPVFLFFAAICTGCSRKANDKLVIATAANVQFAMEALTDAFTANTGIACDIILGSSGKLTAQIREGAPYDVFVSANLKYPNDLHAAGLTTRPPEVYAYGKLVLWTLTEGLAHTPDVLTDDRVKHIAIANPETAPYGAAALEALKYYGVYETVKHKLVYGESIAQTNQFILSGTATLGFTSKSVILSPAMKGKGHWQETARAAYTPIAQGVAVIKKDGKNVDAAEKFFTFLFTEQARGILEEYGYEVKK